MITQLLLLAAGFILLISGANWLIDGASSIARRFNVPNIVIGLTIVAFGTSAPELVVNVIASVNHNTELVLGNVIGSNIFNVFVILGLTAIIFPLSVHSNTTWIEIPLNFLAALIVIVICADKMLNGETLDTISRSEGIICLFFFLIFMVYTIRMMLKGETVQDELPLKMHPTPRSVLMLVAGFAALLFGGRLIVTNAVRIAVTIGLTERIIALTVVSVGTSLPELATSIAAARKRNVDLAIGNIVGSNIFNIFFILGTSATIGPVSVAGDTAIDLGMNLFGGLLLFIFIFTGRGRRIERWEGVLFLLIYLVYMYFIWPK